MQDTSNANEDGAENEIGPKMVEVGIPLDFNTTEEAGNFVVKNGVVEGKLWEAD